MNRQLISVWIVEDDPDDRDLIAEAFGENPLPVITTGVDNAVEALKLLEKCGTQELPNIIVSDYNMPLMNGYQFMASLAKHNKYDSIKKVILSTASIPGDKQKCEASGANACFVKPVNYGHLVKIAADILSLAAK